MGMHDFRRGGNHLMPIEAVAKRLAVSTRTVRRWIERGELVAHRLGHQWRIAEDDLQAFLAVRRGRNLRLPE